MIASREVLYAAMLSLSFVGSAFAQSPTSGEILYRKFNCQICHGEEGRGGVRSGYPILYGQDKRYLAQQLADIRDGVRDSGQAMLMRPLVEQLNNLEIEEISIYLSGAPK